MNKLFDMFIVSMMMCKIVLFLCKAHRSKKRINKPNRFLRVIVHLAFMAVLNTVMCLQNELKGERGDNGVKGEKGEPAAGFYDPRFGGVQGAAGSPGPQVRPRLTLFK